MKYLSIVSVNLVSNVHTFEALVSYLKSRPHDLASLTLSECNFGSVHLLKLTEALYVNYQFEELDLSYNKLTAKQKSNQSILRNLSLFVNKSFKLRHLNLQGMHIKVMLDQDAFQSNLVDSTKKV
jgi:hypothetical protein